MSRTIRFALFPALSAIAAVVATVLLGATLDVRAQGDLPPAEYRIEIVIVEPAAPRSDAWPADTLERFDAFADPGLIADFADALIPAWAHLDALGLPLPRPLATRVGVIPVEDDDEVAEAEGARGVPPVPVERPPRWMALEPGSDDLFGVEQRLTRDGSFQPVTRMTWLQTVGTPRRPRPVRVHDDVIIQRESAPDPVQATPARAETSALDTPAAAPRSGRASIDASIDASASLRPRASANEPTRFEEAQALPAMPPVPRAYPRLDGTFALVQRQFLHAELDLHWREQIERPRQPGESELRSTRTPVDAAGSGGMPQIQPAAGWQVHRLIQSRVIRPDRWTWFDSERFGVLVRVSELPPLLPLPPPELPLEAQPESLESLPEPTDRTPTDVASETSPGAQNAPTGG